MFSGEKKNVNGVTWLENKIYTINRESSVVRTFQDHEPFNEETPIEVKGMTDPSDMVVSKVNRAIFICDWEETEEGDNNSGCVWMIQIPDRKIIRCGIDGRPWRLSITPSNDLLVTSERSSDYPTFLNKYKLPEVEWLKTIHMPTEIEYVWHALQTTSGNFIITCANTNFPDMVVICELSLDGTHINRTFGPQSIDSIPLKTWAPHLAIDEDRNIFVVDNSDDGHRVFQLNSRLNRIEMELNHDRHQIDKPNRLCYVQEKHMLIVGQKPLSTGDGSFCVFEFL